MFEKNFIPEFLSDQDLEEISHAIREIEKSTSGEIRVCIKRKRGYLEKEYSPREIALNEFAGLKMHETKDRTGVLFFILFEENKFEIIADEGINSKIPEDEWDLISESIRKNFTVKKYREGIIDVLEKIGVHLINDFPAKEGDINELPDDVIVKP
ncbi:MAG: TPM domain-containing protein [Bacteroidetes bacterium]|nr:TPM domain-containing protein [Bacteroidota bacterium]